MTQNLNYRSPLSLLRFSPVSASLCCCFSLCTHYTCAAHSYAHSHSAANKWESRIDNNNTETTDKESLHSKLLGVTRACLCFARAVSVAVAVAVSVAVASLTWESPGCLLPIVVVSIIIIIAHKLLSNYMYMCVCLCVCTCVCTLWLALLCPLILGGFIGRRRHSYLPALPLPPSPSPILCQFVWSP